MPLFQIHSGGGGNFKNWNKMGNTDVSSVWWGETVFFGADTMFKVELLIIASLAYCLETDALLFMNMLNRPLIFIGR